MPYAFVEDLPDSIRKCLPEHGQEIFMKTFNEALLRYRDEPIAFKVAWTAVKKQYTKSPNGMWEKKECNMKINTVA